MARRPRVLAPHVLYHVIVRGNHRHLTFRTPSDYQACLDRLARYRQSCQVRLWAYCLMPNHVHLLVETTDVPLSGFMQRLQQSYTQYFNPIHRTVGHLFQGRYKAIVCEQDRYLLALNRYIHLNPVRAKLVTRPDAYRYSGHTAYLDGHPTAVLDPRPELAVFGDSRAYRQFVREGTGEGHQADYYAVTDQRCLGTARFVKDWQTRLDEPPPPRSREGLSRAPGCSGKHGLGRGTAWECRPQLGGVQATDIGGLCPHPAVGLSRARCCRGDQPGSSNAERPADTICRAAAQRPETQRRVDQVCKDIKA